MVDHHLYLEQISEIDPIVPGNLHSHVHLLMQRSLVVPEEEEEVTLELEEVDEEGDIREPKLIIINVFRSLYNGDLILIIINGTIPY